MRVSLQTLKSLVDLTQFSPKEIANKLSLGGLEVESIEPFEQDTIFELKITPNRPDALSHMGVARELAALFNVRTAFSASSVKELGASTHDLLQLSIVSKTACPRYACRVIEGVKVAESPEWLCKKLLSLGLKPVNNLVDITNWVLLERGQPMHAFDLDKIAKVKSRFSLKIRQAESGEKLTTLDGKERSLEPSDLVIADEEKVLALAGIMGGQNSEISTSTQNILVESAYFEPSLIRKSAKRLQMSTDSSYRFERGTDPNGVLQALDRACVLIQEIAGGRLRRDVLDLYPKPIESLEIALRPAKLAALSALPETALDPVLLRTRFLSLGIETAGRAAHEALTFRIPTFRPDIVEEIDLIEEAMRLIGFEQIPAQISFRKKVDAPSFSFEKVEDRLEMHLRVFFRESGFFEAINYAFGSPREFGRFQSDDLLRLQNPLGEEFSVLRPSLLPGLFRNIALNLSQQVSEPALFEIGAVFLGTNEQGQKPKPTSVSMAHLAADAYAHEKLMLSGMTSSGDFFGLKGVLESLFESLHVEAQFRTFDIAPAYVHPGKSAQIWIADQAIGWAGFLHPEFEKESSYPIFELDLDSLKAHCFKSMTTQALPKFPGIRRDLALLVELPVLAADILKRIKDFKPFAQLLEDLKIFDVYQGKNIESGKKSVAISLFFRRLDRTLTEEEIKPLMAELTSELEHSLGAMLRA